MTNTSEKPFSQIVDEAMTKLKNIKGARRELLRRFEKSEATISNWRSGKTEASDADKIHFLEVVTGIARDIGTSSQQIAQRKEQAIEEYNKLFA